MSMSYVSKSCLTFTIIAECNVSNARTSTMALPHYTVETPVFMPVGTKGTMKGMLPEQLERLDCQLILGNAYHLGTRPGPELLKRVGGLHKFMGWKRALLTDSGGFQMVSLSKLSEVTENGVKFSSPYNGSECMLTPEECIKIQNAIGADIIMQLDDVIATTVTGPRVEEATYRTNRWLDRCLAAHERPEDQNIFPIVQGSLDENLRKISAKNHTSKDVNGFAIGGLSGGESKDSFWRTVLLSAKMLPKNKPIYVMGVGYAVDLLVCCALGVDMFDCVFPTRTARFGCALVPMGQLNLKKSKFALDFKPIDEDCTCTTCKRHSRAFLHSVVAYETTVCHLLTVHNIHFQMTFMKSIRKSIKQQRFPEFTKEFLKKAYPELNYPTWVVEALQEVNIHL